MLNLSARKNRLADPGKKPLSHYLRRDWQLYVLLSLPLLFTLVFKYGAMFGLVIAFKDYKILKGFLGSEWVGWEIFGKVFTHRSFVKSVRNTLMLNVLDLVVSFPMPILLALLLNEIHARTFKKISQTILYLPHFLSWIIIGSLAYQLFSVDNGIVNAVLEFAGWERFPFLQKDVPWLFSYVFIGAWQSMGWGTIIYLAAITSVSPELYEAARIDGAGRVRQMISVTLPCIRSTIVTLLIMNLGRIMGGSFERVNSLMNYATTEFTSTIPVLVYEWGIQNSKFSRATALGLFQSVVGLVLVMLADRAAKHLGEEGLI